jgi:7,8-dihydropterin-6-yl-methyl-4-(beta-D-ribofuranosyl)aminobenzene 5'-phosphate synthase
MSVSKIALTIIMDNYVQSSGLIAEHGWSILIESGEDRILFDFGASHNIIPNLKQLGFTAHMINKIFISHGHYDHTGGLYYIARSAGRQIKLFTHPAVFEKKYKLIRKLKKTYIGMPFEKDVYSDYGISFMTGKESLNISGNIYSTGEIEQILPFERSSNNFLIKRNGFNRSDDLRDDTSLIIDTQKGIILITGCAHRGLISSIRQAQKISGKGHFNAVIGGFHLANKDRSYMEKILLELKDTSIDLIVPAHCSGVEGYRAIKEAFGVKCQHGYTGKKIIFNN